jgi:hypothetical protein
MTSSLDKIIKNIETNKLKKIYKEFNAVIKTISKFVIKKNLILYGGLVINLILPKKHRFYKDYTINDYDCFSKNPLEDSYELSEIINKANYKYIKIRRAVHEKTYRIYVYGKQIFDITFINEKMYDMLLEYNKKEVKKLKYYKSKYKIIPLDIVKQNLYFELARPEQSGFRWEKIYKRLQLLENTYPLKKTKNVTKCIPVLKEYNTLVKKVLKNIKDNKYPIIESFALKLYNETSQCCLRLSNGSIYITILSPDMEKTKTEIEKIVDTLFDDDKYSAIFTKTTASDIYKFPCYVLKLLNVKTNDYFNIIKIIECKNECFSVDKIKGYVVGSVDTNIYFLYTNYIINNIYIPNQAEAQENLYYINEYYRYIEVNFKGNIEKRLKTKCFGEINYEEEIKLLWNKRLTVEYIN